MRNLLLWLAVLKQQQHQQTKQPLKQTRHCHIKPKAACCI